MLVLDEPSNHVDLATAERLEAVLRRGGPFGGTLLMVSHDRALLESTCDQLVVLDGLGTAEVFKGTIARWITKRAQAESNFTETDAAVRLAPTKKKSSPLDRLSLADLEAKIEQIESRLSQIQSSMGEEVAWSDPAAMQQLVDEQQSLTTELEAHEQAWVSRSE
jgi:ATPase subunit of ABC transporter with duplicated ATPase domains